MKKYLVLLVALSLLAFAGSAFATSVTPSLTDVTVTAGETTTVTVTGTASHGGNLSYAVSGTGAAFATLGATTGESTTVTLAPAETVQANTYTITVAVTETYSVNDPSAVGHVGYSTETGTVDITVTVNSPAPTLTFTVTPSATTIMAGETVNFTFSYRGRDGTPKFSLLEAVEGVVLGNTAGIFTPKAAGTYTLIFTATDALGIGAVENQTVTIEVVEVLAAKAELSKNPVSVDEEVTITLTATGGIGESKFTAESKPGLTLGTTTNNTATATFRSNESGIYALKFTATDTAEHTATTAVSVIVDALPPEPEAEDVSEDVVSEDVEENVTTTAHELSSDLTTEVNEDTIAKTMSQNAGAAIASDDTYTEEEKALAEGIDEKNEAAVDSLKSDGTFPEDAESVPQEDVTITPSSNTDHATVVAEDNARSGRGESAPFMGFGARSTRDGIIKVPTPKQPQNMWGLLIRVFKAVAAVTNNRALPGFTAAADDDGTDNTVFLDSNGNVTTTIPTSVDVNGNPRIGGYMTIMTYVKANEPVDIILSVPTEELETAGISTATKPVEVVLPFTASGTSYFSTFVSSDILTNTDYYRIGENVLTSKLNNVEVRGDWTRTPEELALATDNNYTMITRLASLDATAEEATHTYIVTAVFSADQAKIERIDTTDEGGFIFYPNGPAEAAANVEVLKLVTRDDETTGFDDLTPEDIKNGVTNGYLAFSVAGGSEITKPMLAVKLVPATTEFSFAFSTNGVTVQQGKTETLSITPVNNSGDVSYTATEGTTALDWITFNGDEAVFAPTTSTAARVYTVTITGTDEANKVYSTDITVTVTADSGGGDITEALTLTASKSSLSMVLGSTETLQLYSNASSPTYSVVAYKDDAVVDEEAGVTLDAETGEALIVPTEVGTYTLRFTVTDAGRTTDNTKSLDVTLTVRASGNPGSSGGGCDAGFTALALAVLGGFIAARKK